MTTLRQQMQADTAAIAADLGVALTFQRFGLPLRIVTGFYSPRSEVATEYQLERTIQRATITLLNPADAEGITVTDTVIIAEIGERKLFGQPKQNAFGWITWELASL
jgi:hypothetical protein